MNLFFTGWHDIIDAQNNLQGQLFIKIKYKPYEDNHGETELPCPDTYFPLRKGALHIFRKQNFGHF